MPAIDPRSLFERRKEWTARKHTILDQYVVPAATKLKGIAKCQLVLVDGYAGQGDYDGEKAGSTHCMIAAARRVAGFGTKAVVIACEPNGERFKRLCSNIADAEKEGIVIPLNKTHAEAIPTIKLIAGDDPMLVFLDPHKPRELLLDRDLFPWLDRPRTDVLGVFMANGVCRHAAFLAKRKVPAQTEATLVSILGSDWRKAITEEAATELFMQQLERRKTYVGAYRLRKRDRMSFAYVVFGASSSHHGMKLLSDAVARDRHMLADFDERKDKAQESLFELDEALHIQKAHMDRLKSFVKPALLQNPHLSGQQLMLELHREPSMAKQLFGEFIEKDYTLAKRLITGG